MEPPVAVGKGFSWVDAPFGQVLGGRPQSDCAISCATKVRNIKQYLRAMLFNAPSTINSYYASLVAHDMAQPDWGRPPNT